MTSQITIFVGQADPNKSKFGNLTGQIISNIQFFCYIFPFGHILSGAIAFHPVAFDARLLLNEKEKHQWAIFHSLDIMCSGQFHRSVRICRGIWNNNFSCYGGYCVTPEPTSLVSALHRRGFASRYEYPTPARSTPS